MRAAGRSLGRMETVEYSPGRLVDLFGDPTRQTVLVWHGMQTDARTSLRPLAELVAGHGLAVVVPDWDSDADDKGRGDLVQSAYFAQQRGARADGLVVVGWSMGGVAAAGLAVAARRLDIRVRHTVCLAGAFMAPDPISGRELKTDVLGNGPQSPFTLLHGVADDVVPISASRAFVSDLEENGWPVDMVELDADHASIAGATYDPAAGRYSAADDSATLAVAADVAARIAAAAG